MIYTLLKYAGVMLGIYALLIVLMYVFQERFLFMPDQKYYAQSDVGVNSYAEITVTTADSLTLKGWYTAAQPNMPTVLFFHGNASTWQWRARDFEFLAAKGYGVLMAGYRGYGGNAGTPSEAGFYKDAEAYLGYLATQNVKPENIVLYGESLGTGVAVEMAHRHKHIRALVLEVPFSSIAETAAIHYPFVPFMDRIVRNRFDSIYKIGTVTAPKLFLLAGFDRVIPPAEGKRLFEYAPAPKTLKTFDNAGHNDIRAMGGLVTVDAWLTTLNN